MNVYDNVDVSHGTGGQTQKEVIESTCLVFTPEAWDNLELYELSHENI